MKTLFAIVVALTIPAAASACPPVQVQAFVAPQAFVQSYAAPVSYQAVVQPQSYAIQAVPVAIQVAPVVLQVRERRQPFRAFFQRPRPVRVNVQTHGCSVGVCF